MNSQRVIITAAMISMLVACATPNLDLPDPPSGAKNLWATQGWTNADRHWYHHAEQGTNTFGMPVEWFKALEQPGDNVAAPALFSDQDYLARFGFIKSPVSVERGDAAKHGYTAPAQQSKYSGYSANPENLPVGFAVGGEWLDSDQQTMAIPGTKRNTRSFGLTCAACHTGQLEYQGHRILIDGGPSMISLDKIREALQAALKSTLLDLPKFDRFAQNVLGDANSLTHRLQLRFQFDKFLIKAMAVNKLEEKQTHKDGALVEGFARLDALNRIGNEVFAGQMELPDNMHPITAPVSFPFIWNAPWFDWVQYNSSIQQPMVRNLGEAMGVKGKVTLTNPANPFKALIPVQHLHEMEQLLAGDKRPLEARKFGGLQSPKWSEFAALGIFQPLNQERVAQGRKLYLRGDPAKQDTKGLCVGCHLPPVDTDEIFSAEFWQPPATNPDHKFLALVAVPVMEIGTDCRTAYGMVYRNVSTPNFIGNSGTLIPAFEAGQFPKDCPQPAAGDGKTLPAVNAKAGFTTTNFGVALGEVVGKTKDRWYADTGKSPVEQLMLDGYRPNGIRATVVSDSYPSHCRTPGAPYPVAGRGKDCPNPPLPAYRARPLNGVWATAPFLHNGSVPNLYLLLGTQKERDQQAGKFHVGSREYDPTYVGYRYRVDKGPALRCSESPGTPLLTDAKGLFELDTAILGNRNTGHLFFGGKPTHRDGHIGRALTCDERFAIIEFLKSL